MRSRLLVVSPLLLAALTLGPHPQSSFAAGPPVHPHARPALVASSAVDYDAYSEQAYCSDPNCDSGAYNEMEVYKTGPATFGVPDYVYGYCESWTPTTDTWVEGEAYSPLYLNVTGSSTSGVGGAIGSWASTAASGYAFAANGIAGSRLSSYGYGNVSVTGVDVANNVTRTMTSGSFTVNITNGRVYTYDYATRTQTSHIGSMSCRVTPGNAYGYNYAYNVSGISNG